MNVKNVMNILAESAMMMGMNACKKRPQDNVMKVADLFLNIGSYERKTIKSGLRIRFAFQRRRQFRVQILVILLLLLPLLSGLFAAAEFPAATAAADEEEEEKADAAAEEAERQREVEGQRVEEGEQNIFGPTKVEDDLAEEIRRRSRADARHRRRRSVAGGRSCRRRVEKRRRRRRYRRRRRRDG